MTIQKTSFIVGWSATILVETLVVLGFAWITLDPSGRVENSPVVWFCVALIVALVSHLTLVRFVEALRIRNAAIRSGLNRVWTTVSGIREFMSLLKSSILLILTLLAMAWLGSLLQRQWARGELQASVPTLAYGGGFLAYCLVLAPLFHLLKGKSSRGAGFRCVSTEDKLLFSMRDKTFDLEIGELIELRVLADYAEGAAFYQRNLASNIPVMVKNPIEISKWLAGKTGHPKVFIQPPSTGLASIFVRTPQLLLFAPLLQESVDTLKPFEKTPPQA